MIGLAHLGAIYGATRSAGGGGEPGPVVSFVAASATVFSVINNYSVVIPAAVQPGDLLLAHAHHYDYPLTPAAGWTKVAEIRTVDGSVNNALGVYKKIAGPADAGASTTWTTSPGSRIAVHIQAFRADGGCNVVDSATYDDDLSDGDKWHMAALTATADGQMMALSATSLIVAHHVSMTVGTITTPTGTVANNRLAAGYVSRGSGQGVTTADVFQRTAIAGSPARGAATILIG